MSSAVSSTNVPSTPILVTPSTDSTKTSSQQSPFDFNSGSSSSSKHDESTEDQRHLNKQSSANKIYTRGNSNKNKQLTRSHAMKETASPPRTPNSHSPSDMKSHSPTAPALVTQNPDDSASSQLLTPPPTFVLPLSEQASGGKSQLDIDFPKLTPPKTKWSSNSPPGSNTNTATRSHNRKSVSSDTSSNNNSICEDGNEPPLHVNDNCTSNKASQQKTGSQISNSSTNNNNTNQCEEKTQRSESENDQHNSSMSADCKLDDRDCMSPSSHTPCKSPSNPSGNNNYTQNDNNNNSGSKSSSSGSFITVKGKPPLKNMGSSSSCEGGNTSSGFISRDSSSEQFVDQNGIDLVQFFKETLNKNAKDRNMLLKIERDLISLAVDQTGRTFTKFPPMSSYNRMLVHRTAAYFGMDHNVDSTQQCVIASVSKDTRIPEIRFKTLIRDTFSEEPRKSILRREAHSFEDYRQGGLLAVHRGILNRKAKSFEEREEEYDKDWQWIQQEREEHGGDFHNKLKVPSRGHLMKGHSTEGRYGGGERNPSVSKSHSFGSYGGPNSLTREDSINSNKSGSGKLHKQDSLNTTWRFSPSSSGFKSQSMRSDSFTPSPTGYGSDTPEASSHSPDRGVVWAVTDLASVPKGSLIIDPQTLQPILNQDGSLYHFDPSNPPAKTGRYGSASRKKTERKSLTNNNNSTKPTNKESSNTTNNSSIEKSTNNKIITHPKVNIVNDDEIEDDIDDDNDGQTDLHLDTPSKSHQQQQHQQQQPAQETKDSEDFENKSSQCEVNQYLNAEEMSPKRKSQATSPNLPLNDLTINEEEESISPTIIEDNSNEDDVKKDEIISTSATATPPVQEIRYSNQYVNTANSTVTPTAVSVMSYAPPPAFTAPIAEPGGAIYHTGPDGTLYVLSQPVMYSYAPSTENEVTNCWVPIFDQGALQSRDANIPTAVMTYQPAAAAAAPTTLYTTQSPVVYSTEQFANQSPQVAQYPGYPTMGYTTYPVNGAPYQNFWPQPMTTYILPQPTATPQPGQVIINQPGAPQTPNTATLIQSTAHNTSHNPSTNSSNSTGRRNTPPSNHHTNNGNRDGNNHIVSSSTTIQATAVPLQTFPTSVPLSEAGQGQGPQTIYALPPSMYQNVLPYQTAPTASFYQPLPHPPANTTIISSVIPHSNAHPPQSGTLPSTPHSYQSNAGTHITASGEVVTHFPFTHTNNSNNQHTNNVVSTPQSTPSTPITIHQNFKNPPLFATPPIIASVSTTPSVHMEKNNSSGGVYLPKKYNGNSVMNTPPPAKSNTRYSVGGGYQQNNNNGSTLVNAQGGKKSMNYNPSNSNNNNSNANNNSSNSSSEDPSSLTLNNSNSTNNNYRAKNRDQPSAGSSNYQPKSSSYVPKGQQQQHSNQNYSNSQSPNSNDNTETGKYVHRGPSRAVPPSLDLNKRNNSNTNVMTNNYHHHNRSTPSTNSTESNNSPNSITSYDHSRNFHYSHNPAPAHFIRGGSAGPGTMNNANDAAPMPTYFPFNVQNPAGASAQLIDPCQNQALIGYNNSTGMYVKLGPAVTFANPNPNSRKSPSNDMRMVSGIYTMPMLQGPTGPRHMNPRAVQNNHNNNFKGNRPQR